MYKNFFTDLHHFTNSKKSTSLLQKIHRLRQYPGMKLVLLNRLINETPSYLFPIKILLKYMYKKNTIKYGIYLPLNLIFGSNLRIYHFGGIIINPNSKIGDNVTIMQGVTIGNNMKNAKAPIINDNVLIGAGAKVIGDVFIAKNVKIGANAVVTHSHSKKGSTLIGVPAKELKNN